MAKSIAISLFLLLLLGSAYMAFQRLGLLPWLGIVLGAAGLGLMTRLNIQQTFYYLAISYSLVIAGWVGSAYYVFSTWESGEVVEIRLADQVSFRTWVVELAGKQAVIYDCPPEHQSLLESSKVVSVTRGGQQVDAAIEAHAVDYSSQALIDVFDLYEEKYAAESRATDVYYLTIGPRRGSQLYVLYLTRPDA